MKCPACNKEGAYVRVRTNDIRCNQCGKITKIEVKETKNERKIRV